MQSIRKRDTGPEIRVRKALHAAGLRYRLHARDLPGTPDIVFRKARIVVLVHGCFWHQHEGCKLARRPKGNRAYWEPKLARNMARDLEAHAALVAAGWDVVTVWECEASQKSALDDKVRLVQRKVVDAAA